MTLNELIAQGCPDPVVHPVSESDLSALSGRIEELAAKRDFSGICRLCGDYPVSGHVLDCLKRYVGLGFLLQKRFNLAEAVSMFGESWLQSDSHPSAGHWEEIPDAVVASIIAGDLLLENPHNEIILKALTAALTAVMAQKDSKSICLLELAAIERDMVIAGTPARHSAELTEVAALLQSFEAHEEHHA